MRKGVIKAVVLVLVFWTTILVMELTDQQSNVNLTSEMEQATLPVVYLQWGDTRINEVYGYTSKMDGTAMRDTITPLKEDLSLPITIKTYQNQIAGVSYEVRTMNTERLIANGEIDSFSKNNGEVSLALQFQNILEEGTEYVLELTVACGEKPVYYYTRILRETDCYVQESLDFAMSFHEQTFDKENADSLATYLEPDSQEDNTSLQKVTIHSSLNQICWADFEGERMEKPVPSIKELSPYYNTVILQYVLTSAGENGEVEYYNVEEYYRIRYNDLNSRMYLLNYERTMNQIFRGENGLIDESKLLLGIRSEDVEYMENEKGNIIAFVQEGELWSYKIEGNELSQVYSFRNPEGITNRENNNQHGIEIMQIDETGSMDFVVYGYMNRGNHEGQTGINVFHYDSVGNTIEEELFVPSDKSFEMLKADWGSMFYINKENIFYLLAEDVLYRIDLPGKETKRVVEKLKQGSYAASEDGRYIAWQSDEGDDSFNILKVMDLEGETIRTIEGAQGEFLKPVGFVESDFVYGAAKAEDVEIDDAGNANLLMYKIAIVDKNAEEVKQYQKDGYYVSRAYVEDDTIFLDRGMKQESRYRKVDQDTIKNQQLESSRLRIVDISQTEKKQRQVYMVLGDNAVETEKQPRVIVPKEVVLKDKRIVKLDAGRRENCYYIYCAGKILMSTPSITEAISCADNNMGIVIDEEQKYIWRRGKKSSQPVIEADMADITAISENPVARCLTYLLRTEEISMDVDDLLAQGKTPKQILTEALTERKVIDLTGCSVEQALYYVNMETPVFAMVNGEVMLIVGYDEHNTILYYPNTNETKKMGLQDSNTLFEAAGNVFLGYIE